MKRKPIISKGERLSRPIQKGQPRGGKKPAYEYEEARNNILNNLSDIQQKIIDKKEIFIEDEIVVCARMAAGYLAKSYMPSFIERYNNISIIGARNYIINKNEIDEKSKLYFIKTDIDSIENLKKSLNDNNLNKTAREQLCNIERIDLLDQHEKISGFEEFDDEDDVEIILHPIEDNYDQAIKIITMFIGEDYLVKRYTNGPIFILAHIDKEKVEDISALNFLRTVHPLRNIDITKNRFSRIAGSPKVELADEIKNEDRIKVGVFDGGVIDNHSLIHNYVKSHDLSSLPRDMESLIHGTAVCGSVLYGELNKFSNDDIVKAPKVFVESFRVLPETNLYKIIDNIETVVEERDDIKVYNISFGPRGPIEDDNINRFTYSLDRLSYKYDVLFCVAVGNDGDVMEPFNRIQAPSDLVNGIGIGAYSKYENKIYRAKYSCIGNGREGAKIKPEILAFGGDERTPFHAVSINDDERIMIAGTSFASPLLAGRIGELLYISNDINPIVAKSIVLHSAKNEIGNIKEEGFGILDDNIYNIINCDKENEVTILYTGKILPKTYIELPIPLPDIEDPKGKIELNWTITSMTDVDALDSDGYTKLCIEDTFHPNINMYSMSKKGVKKLEKINLKNTSEFNELLNNGYKQSKFQLSDSPAYFSEEARRLNLQWDTTKRKLKNKYVNKIENPCIVLHCIPRNDRIYNSIKFCLALTIKMKKYDGDLYDKIVEKYPVLNPITLRNENDIDININTEI